MIVAACLSMAIIMNRELIILTVSVINSNYILI